MNGKYLTLEDAEKIANYETVMIKTSNDEVIKTINKNMLDLLNGYLA